MRSNNNIPDESPTSAIGAQCHDLRHRLPQPRLVIVTTRAKTKRKLQREDIYSHIINSWPPHVCGKRLEWHTIEDGHLERPPIDSKRMSSPPLDLTRYQSLITRMRLNERPKQHSPTSMITNR